MESSECPLTICAVRGGGEEGIISPPSPPDDRRLLLLFLFFFFFFFVHHTFLYQPLTAPLPPHPLPPSFSSLLYNTGILIYSHVFPRHRFFSFLFLSFPFYLCPLYYTVDPQTTLRPRPFANHPSLHPSSMYARRNFDGARLWENRNLDQIWPDIAIFERCLPFSLSLSLSLLWTSCCSSGDLC